MNYDQNDINIDYFELWITLEKSKSKKYEDKIGSNATLNAFN